MHRLQELIRLHRHGVGCRKSAQLLGMSPNTERMYRRCLLEAGLWEGPTNELPELEALLKAVEQKLGKPGSSSTPSKALTYQNEIQAMLKKGAQPQAIYDHLKLRYPDLDCSPSSVKRLCARIKKSRGISSDDVAIPVVSAPGEIAQVDFGYVGTVLDAELGRKRKVWVFVMTLAHSRLSFMDVVYDQSSETFLHLHRKAFEFFGGTPKTLVPDNLKSAVIQAAFNNAQTTELNRSYCEAARHYGFKIDPTPAYSPEKKGIVESAVKYVKNNFFLPRADTFRDIEEMRTQLKAWLLGIANVRVHGTTREAPQLRFERDEEPALLPLPGTPFELVTWKEATIQQDSHVVFRHVRYSAPFRLIGQKAWIRASQSQIRILVGDILVATHIPQMKGYSTIDAHLPEKRRDLRYRSPSYWEERAKSIGPECDAYVKAIFAQKDAMHQLRVVQRVLPVLEGVSSHRAEAAAKRARYFANFKANAVVHILEKGLECQPFESLLKPKGLPASFRYQRRPEDILRAHIESEVQHVIH